MKKFDAKYWGIALTLLFVLVVYRQYYPTQNTLNLKLASSLLRNNSEANNASISLIERGANTNFEKREGDNIFTPLKLAAIYNNTAAAKALIQHNAKVNQISSGTTALDFACSYRNKEIVELLIEHGAKRNSSEVYTFEDSELSLKCKAKESSNASK